jgi:hypothetical protein
MQILLSIALLVYQFEFELEEWTTFDGVKSDREAKDDRRYAGSIAMFPDRDLTFRWKKVD